MEWWRRARAEVRRLSQINGRELVEPIEVEVELWQDTEQGTSWFTARSNAFLPHGWGKTADQAVDDFADAVERYYHDIIDIATRLGMPDLPELVELRARFSEAEAAVADPKRIVAQGYDQIAERYRDWSAHTRVDERSYYTALLRERLPVGAVVLELGCGTGVPTTRELARHFVVSAVDISARHVELARQHVPGATIIHADMTSVDFPPSSFDALVAFYSIIHVPREEHPMLLRRIAKWLRPGGLLVATMGARSTKAAIEPDWHGVPMYWSHYDGETNRRLVEEAGLRIVQAREETADEDGEPVTFLWIVAEKP